jgi:hypothetical protein
VEFYRRNLPHLQKDFTPHFITFVTKFRWILPPSAREIVVSSCCHDHRKSYELYVAMVMPDRVHIVLAPLLDEKAHEIHSLNRDYANNQKRLCALDQSATEAAGPCLAEGVIRSCTAVVGESRRQGGLHLAESSAQGTGRTLAGFPLDLAEAGKADS